MFHREIVESFRKLEEKVHTLAGVLTATCVSTEAIRHALKKGLPEHVSNVLEVLHSVLEWINVVIAVLLVVGLVLRAIALRKPNRIIRRLARDKEISRHIQRWLSQENINTDSSHVRFCTEECIEQLTALNYTAFEDLSISCGYGKAGRTQ